MLNYKLLFTESASLTPKGRKKKKKLWSRCIGISLVIIQIIIAIMFLFSVFHLNIVPTKYIVLIIIVLLLATAFNLISQYSKTNIFGKIIAVFLSIILLTGFIFISKAANALEDLSKEATASVTQMSIIVLADDSAQNLEDAKNYSFGYNAVLDKSNTDVAITKINEKLGTTIDSVDYPEWNALVNALYNHEAGAIILNEAYRSAIEEIFTDFASKTKVIDNSITIENKNAIVQASDVDVSNETFTIYIAGNDQYGTVSNVGRNDVNIIATFNPKTRQVLLVTTPRDYYIPLDNLSGSTGKDKLTHAGNFGMLGSITALQNLYDINLDYYFKLNFTGTIKIVDALGGVTIDSEVAFTSTDLYGRVPYPFKVGPNNCDGEKALAFCRERYAFSDGDFQRGRNQMLAIKGIIAKATSPAIITNYSAVLNSVSSLFETNMPTDKITTIIRDTLDDPTAWNIQTYNVSGDIYTMPCELFGFNASVVVPDYSSVNTAKQYMNQIRNGETLQLQ